MMRRVALQHLLGRKVIDVDGKNAGRIEEFHAQNRDGKTVITSYSLGRGGLKERLSIHGFSLMLLRPLGAHRTADGHRVPWQQMDLSDPKHPRLRCTVKELEAMQK